MDTDSTHGTSTVHLLISSLASLLIVVLPALIRFLSNRKHNLLCSKCERLLARVEKDYSESTDKH